MNTHPKILIVDDEPFNVDYLEQELEDLDYDTVSAFNGYEALKQVPAESPDLILLDIMMPGMDGFEVLERLKASESWRNIPVIIISAMDDIDSVVRGIKLGAEDYLPKPFNEVLLQARIEASLEKKRWHDKEQAYLAEIEAEREKSEQLLLNVLPREIANILKDEVRSIAQYHESISILFADLVGFTPLCAQLTPQEIVALLDEIFSYFDGLAEKYRVEKIRTIGDNYMVASGVPSPRPDHAQALCQMALDMNAYLQTGNKRAEIPLDFRIGINSGSVIAGVIGVKKFQYDIWGDAVNTASRMESHGVPGRIHISQATYDLIKDDFSCVQRGTLDVKGKGPVETFFLVGRK